MLTNVPIVERSLPRDATTDECSVWNGRNQFATSLKNGNPFKPAKVDMNTSPPSSCILDSSLILSVIPDLSSNSCHSGFSSSAPRSAKLSEFFILLAISGRSFIISGSSSSCILRLIFSVSRERINCKNTILTSLCQLVVSRRISMRGFNFAGLSLLRCTNIAIRAPQSALTASFCDEEVP